MPKLAKSLFRWSVRICAVGTFIFGIYAVVHFVIPAFKHPLVDFIVTGKSIGAGAYCIDFRDPGQATGEDIHYYFNGHQGFYEAAWKGDHMQVAAVRTGDIWGDGYRQLVRDGRVVARSYADEQCYGILFIAATMLPVLVFLPVKNKIVKNVIWGTAVTCEAIVIAMFLLWGLIIYAFGHSTGC